MIKKILSLSILIAIGTVTLVSCKSASTTASSSSSSNTSTEKTTTEEKKPQPNVPIQGVNKKINKIQIQHAVE
ncbi:MAG: hypothetical protein HYU68_07290 [Bacteroidetes bacterium]|nr:hypothetical protein [Bacteroidota bacterium]